MTEFSGWMYLLIDCANNYGHDKMLFEERIKWVETNLNQLESLVDQAETKPLYIKAVMAIRKAQAGMPTGHLVGLDACCSGIQVMSALTGCITGAKHTGLIDPNVRADAYTICTEFMNKELEGTGSYTLGNGLVVARKDAKDALMTTMYGSKLMPKKIFGADTPELNAFYVAAQAVAPGAWELLQDLLGSWQPFAAKHSWKLPDGFDAVVKVMKKVEARIEIDELDHSTFTYEFYVNEGSKNGLSNVANVVHSVDAYVLRCVHRRCNYDSKKVLDAHRHLYYALNFRGMMRCGHTQAVNPTGRNQKIQYYIQQWERSGMADVVILPYIDAESVKEVPTQLVEALLRIIDTMVEHKPFPIVTVHDESIGSPI